MDWMKQGIVEGGAEEVARRKVAQRRHKGRRHIRRMHGDPVWGNALAMKFFAVSVACVYELPCFQQQYHLVAISVSGS
jgi:hypothetical protein